LFSVAKNWNFVFKSLLGHGYVSVLFLDYFLYFEKIKGELMRSSSCLCAQPSHPQHLKAGILEPEETAVAVQQLGKHVPMVTNTHATIEGLLDAVFSMLSVLYQILNMQ
jgi:hypothetical protein